MYERTGQHQRALAVYLELIKRRPFDEAAFKGLTRVRNHLSGPAQQTLSARLQERARQALTQARTLMQAGRYAEAVPLFDVALAADSRVGVWNDYAMALLLSGDSGRAERALRQLPQTRRMWQLRANAALVALSQDKTVAARQHIEAAIALADQQKEKARLYNILGFIEESAHRLSQARFAYERALMYDPDCLKARLNLAYVLQQGYQLEEAAKAYQAVLARRPQDADAWNRLGFVYELMHEPRKARSAYEKAVALDPNHPEAHYNLAMLFQKMGETQQSDAAFRRLMTRRFDRLESGKAVAQDKPTGHPLLTYVDVFLAETP